MLKLFIYSVNLFWLTLPPVFVHRQEQIVTKIVYVFPKILPKSIEFYTGMPVVPVTNSMSGFMLPWSCNFWCKHLLVCVMVVVGGR